MLKLEDLHYSIDDKAILNGINVRFDPFKIHGIVGPEWIGN